MNSPIFAHLSTMPNLENPLEIKLSMFEGPLDLLLHLIRKKELNIYEVPLSELTASYLSYLEVMQSVNLDLAGEFLEIAATLILIKSRQMLPQPRQNEEEDGEDPEELLRQRLIEYQRYKNAAFALASQDMLGREVFARPLQSEQEENQDDQELEFEEISLVTLMEAFARVLRQQRPRINAHVVEVETYRIEDLIDELLKRFHESPRYLFEELFEAQQPKAMIILTFMAILEMAKMKLIRLVQVDLFGSIHCIAHDDFEMAMRQWYQQQDEQAA